MRLKLFAESIDSLKRHKRLFAGERALTLVSLRPGSGGAIARFAEIADRNAAEALRGRCSPSPARSCRRSPRANIIMPT